MIELYNTTPQPVNVGGWWLSNSSSDRTMYQIAANTWILSGAYLVLTDSKNYGATSGDLGVMVPFSLSKYGFTVCLSSNVPTMPNVAGGYQVEESYGATPPGMSVGLVTTSTGEADFVLLSTPSFGPAVNGGYSARPTAWPTSRPSSWTSCSTIHRSPRRRKRPPVLPTATILSSSSCTTAPVRRKR